MCREFRLPSIYCFYYEKKRETNSKFWFTGRFLMIEIYDRNFRMEMIVAMG